jgi:hypothetical protein
MNIDKLDFDLLINKLESIKTEQDLKNQKLEYYNQLLLNDINKKLDNYNELSENKNIDNESNGDNNNIDTEQLIDNTESEIKSDNPDNNNHKEELPKIFKTLYRKIVNIIHPDKIKPNDKNKDLKLNLYLNLQKSIENKIYIDIVLIALKLNINVDNYLDYNELIKQQISKIELENKNIEFNNSWIYCNTKNDSLKEIILTKLVENIIKSKF